MKAAKNSWICVNYYYSNIEYKNYFTIYHSSPQFVCANLLSCNNIYFRKPNKINKFPYQQLCKQQNYFNEASETKKKNNKQTQKKVAKPSNCFQSTLFWPERRLFYTTPIDHVLGPIYSTIKFICMGVLLACKQHWHSITICMCVWWLYAFFFCCYFVLSLSLSYLAPLYLRYFGPSRRRPHLFIYNININSI